MFIVVWGARRVEGRMEKGVNWIFLEICSYSWSVFIKREFVLSVGMNKKNVLIVVYVDEGSVCSVCRWDGVVSDG